jgi:SpoVK/Ycf46/Vps4 family AAA+-type ATPase
MRCLPKSTGLIDAGAQVDDLAAAAHGFVGADLTALCNEAAMAALRRAIRSAEVGPSSIFVGWDDFTAAKTVVRPSALREVAVEVPQVRQCNQRTHLACDYACLWDIC